MQHRRATGPAHDWRSAPAPAAGASWLTRPYGGSPTTGWRARCKAQNGTFDGTRLIEIASSSMAILPVALSKSAVGIQASDVAGEVGMDGILEQ